MKITKHQDALNVGTLQIVDIPFGQACWAIKAKRLLVRVKPTSFLLNSTVIGDVLARGDTFVFAPKYGTVYPVSGDIEVIPVNSELMWSEL